MNLQRYNRSFSRSSIYLPSLVIKNISKIGQHAQLVASAKKLLYDGFGTGLP